MYANSILIGVGIFSFAFRIAQPNLREATKKYTPYINGFGYILLGLTALFFVIDKVFHSLWSDYIFGLVPVWALTQVFLTAYASGIERTKRPW